MPLLPEGTALGRLTPREVYDSYDGPRLFSCRADDGRLFIALWVDEERGVEEWLYLPLTPARLAQLEAGTVDLRTAFARPEGGQVWRVCVPISAGPADAQPLGAGELDRDLLPYEGELLRGSAPPPQAGPVAPIPAPRGGDTETARSPP